MQRKQSREASGHHTRHTRSPPFLCSKLPKPSSIGRSFHRPHRLSHHPLLAVLAKANLVLHSWLRSGKGRREALGLLGAQHRIRSVRADSGFYAEHFLSSSSRRARFALHRTARLMPCRFSSSTAIAYQRKCGRSIEQQRQRRSADSHGQSSGR